MSFFDVKSLVEASDEAKETGRIEAFSDGVFAIAITLLILEIKVPHDLPEESSLASALLKLWPSYLAFLISFVTILIMWINHHRLFRHIKRADHLLLLSNGLLLLTVTIIPFPTQLLAEYIQHKQADAQVAVMVYSGTSILLAVAFNALWWSAAYKKRLLDPKANQADVERISRQYYFGPLLYLAALLLALVSVPASVGLNAALAIFFCLPNQGEVKAAPRPE